MPIPQSHSLLRESFNNLQVLSRQTGASTFDRKDTKFNHPFSSTNGLIITSIQPGHVEAEQTTDSIKLLHHNSQGTLHGGVSMTSADAAMAAAAQSTIGKKLGNKIAVAGNFAQKFFRPVLPGTKLTYITNVTGGKKTHDDLDYDDIKFLQTEIRKGKDIVGQAISTYFIVDKDEHLAMAA